MTQLILMQDKTGTGKGAVVGVAKSSNISGRRSIQVSVEGTGTYNATVRIYGMNDGRFPIWLFDITVNQNGPTDAEAEDFPWEFYQAEVLSVTAGAKVSVMGSV